MDRGGSRPAPSTSPRVDQRRDRDDDRSRYEPRDRREPDRWDRDAYRRYDRGQRFFYRPKHRVHYRPRIHIDIDWPWEYRFRRRWAPRYRYRQVVFVEVGWGQRHRQSRLDVRTRYYHRVRHATPGRAEVDVYIEGIELYENGRYLGEIRHIPAELARIQATIYRNGDVRFDRSVFILGDPYVGFEVISTRHYDRYILDAYHRSHGMRVGRVDLRRGRVVPVRYSRLFDNFDGFVPVSLLPREAGWLYDYGYDSVSGYYYHDDYHDNYYRGDYTDDYYYGLDSGRGAASYEQLAPLRDEDVWSLRTQQGVQIRMQRETELQRIE